MKRLVLGLVMAGGLAFLTSPMANAGVLGECGKSYAFQVHGTEPSSSNDSALQYIVGIGQITFAAGGTDGADGCTVSHLELIYNDGGSQFNAAPNHCNDGGSLLGTGIACFDGGNHQGTGGTLVPSPFGNGAARLTIDPTFTFVNGSDTSGSLPLAFTLQANTGSSIVVGSIVPDNGPTPTSPPPGSPVLVITLQKQSTTVSLPVNGGGDGYGTAPYLGLQVSDFEGFGAQHSDPFDLPGITGTFGSTINVLQIFTNGQAGGSAGFSTNDNVGNTTGVTENDCDTQLSQQSNFADGTTNNTASIVHPSTQCGDAAAGASFTISTVQWGATDTSSYSTVTGLTDTPDLGGEFVPSSDIASAIGYASVPAGKLTSLTLGTLVAINKTVTGTVKLTNTTPAGCDVSVHMASVASGTCSLSLVSGPTVAALVEGDTPSTNYATTSCTCTGTSGSSAVGTLTISSSDCLSSATSPVSVTCKN
jgi:hypothetical protein